MTNKTEADYRKMSARIAALETSVKFCAKDIALRGRGFLTDECADQENVELAESHPDFWNEMYRSLCMSAGMRAENYGFSINEALGEIIY